MWLCWLGVLPPPPRHDGLRMNYWHGRLSRRFLLEYLGGTEAMDSALSSSFAASARDAFLRARRATSPQAPSSSSTLSSMSVITMWNKEVFITGLFKLWVISFVVFITHLFQYVMISFRIERQAGSNIHSTTKPFLG